MNKSAQKLVKNWQKLTKMRFFAPVFPPRRHQDTKKIQSEIRISKSEILRSPLGDALRWKQIRMTEIRNSKPDAGFRTKISHKKAQKAQRKIGHRRTQGPREFNTGGFPSCLEADKIIEVGDCLK